MLHYRLTKRRNEWGEFVVKAYENGKRYEAADYHTDDWQDAVATLDDMNDRNHQRELLLNHNM